MPNFIWKTKNILGKRVAREITADTIEESKEILLGEGCTDLELICDEIVDATPHVKTTCMGVESDVKLTPKQQVKSFSGRSQIFGTIFGELFRYSIFYMTTIMLLAINFYARDIILTIIIGISILGFMLFRIWLALPVIYFDKLNKAIDWSQWMKVLQLLRKIETIQRFHFIKIPEAELIRCRVQAFAGLDRLPEALEEFELCKVLHKIPNWHYNAHLAGIYSIANEQDKALEYSWKAVEEKQTPALYVDLMYLLLCYKKDTAKAREVLIEIEKGTLVELAKPFYSRCLGILAYLEKDYTSAKIQIETALKIFEKNITWSFRDGHVSVTKAHLCCVYARQGDLAVAKSYFAGARKYLVATDQIELMEECREAMGNG